MAVSSVLRGLFSLSRQSVPVASVASRELLSSRGFSSDAKLSLKDAAYMLDNRDDAEVDAAIKAYQKSQYDGAAAEPAGEVLELTSQVERKYVAAQIVEFGIQNIAVPLGASGASTKRYTAQLLKLGHAAGFEDPAKEIEKRIAEKVQTAETAKDLLNRMSSFTSPDFHAALSDGLAAIEAETGASVTLDASSDGYKKFAEKVKSVATAHGIPWKSLVDAKSATSEDAKEKASKEYAAWLQSACVADAAAEIAVFEASATTALDKHLSKTVDQVKKEQAAQLAALQRRIDSAKGAKWAVQFQQDLKDVAAFDAAVAANPAVGPTA